MWKSGSHDPRKFCQPGLIILPLNWGDPIPDLVTLDDAKILFKLPNGTITGGEESKVNSTHCLLKSAGLFIFASSTPFTILGSFTHHPKGVMTFFSQVDVTSFEATEKCSSNPLTVDEVLGPKIGKEWNESGWALKEKVSAFKKKNLLEF